MNLKRLKLNKITIETIFLLLCCIILLMSCLEKKENIELKEKLKHEIEKSLLANGIIDFKEIANFSWDTLFLIPPYTTKEMIKSYTGLKKININTSITALDDIALLLFVSGNDIINYINFPRINGDFATLAKINRNEAKFKIINTGDWINIKLIGKK